METHLIAYARAKNAYDYIMNCQVRKRDLMDVVGDLSQKNRRNHARVDTRVETRVGHNSEPPSSSSVGVSDGGSGEGGVSKRAVSATSSSSSNGHSSDLSADDQHSDKRHRPGDDEAASDMSQQEEFKLPVTETTVDSLMWSEGVDWIGQNYGYRPGDSLIPHIPLQQVYTECICLTLYMSPHTML